MTHEVQNFILTTVLSVAFADSAKDDREHEQSELLMESFGTGQIMNMMRGA